MPSAGDKIKTIRKALHCVQAFIAFMALLVFMAFFMGAFIAFMAMAFTGGAANAFIAFTEPAVVAFIAFIVTAFAGGADNAFVFVAAASSDSVMAWPRRRFCSARSARASRSSLAWIRPQIIKRTPPNMK